MRILGAAVLASLALGVAGCGGGGASLAQSIGGDVNTADFTVAATNLASWYTAHGTYAGASPGVAGVSLGRGDSSSWCLQTASEHENGPNGSIEPGRC
jgi:hypothetical protein